MDFFFYCDRPDDTNNHLIHTDSCSSLPEISNRTLIGKASCYEEALNTIREQCLDKNFSSCKDCCNY